MSPMYDDKTPGIVAQSGRDAPTLLRGLEVRLMRLPKLSKATLFVAALGLTISGALAGAPAASATEIAPTAGTCLWSIAYGSDAYTIGTVDVSTDQACTEVGVKAYFTLPTGAEGNTGWRTGVHQAYVSVSIPITHSEHYGI